MKYRVKFECYWYNTGAADNHHYDNYEDFETLEEAQAFAERVNEQYDMNQKLDSREIMYSDYTDWKNGFDTVEVENGFITGYASIVKYYPEREEKLY